MKSRAEDAESWVSFPTAFLLGEILILGLLIAPYLVPRESLEPSLVQTSLQLYPRFHNVYRRLQRRSPVQ